MKRVACKLLILVLVLASCAQINALVTGAKLTPEARYYDALVTFNQNVEQYNGIYKLSSAETQVKWKSQIDPVIRSASAALDVWKGAINSESAEQAWTTASRQLITMLVTSGIIEIK